MTSANLSQLTSIKRYMDKPENKKMHSESTKRWRKNNPEKVKAYTKKAHKKYRFRQNAEKNRILENDNCEGFCQFEPI